MSQCQAPSGCAFFAPEGRKYCSKHFKLLATEEEKAEANSATQKREDEIKQAKAAWESALDGPISEARDRLTAALAMPGFNREWPQQEFNRAFETKDITRIFRIQECDKIRHRDRPALPALLYDFLTADSDLKWNDPIFDLILQQLPTSSTTVDTEMVDKYLYSPNTHIKLLQKLLPLTTVTEDLVDSAKSLNKAPNYPTKERKAMADLLIATYKEQQKEGGDKPGKKAAGKGSNKRKNESEEEEEEDKEPEPPKKASKTTKAGPTKSTSAPTKVAKSSESSENKSYLECVEGGSSKFYEITLSGTEVNSRYGKIGTSGQTTSKSFDTVEKAKAFYDKTLKEKSSKGYEQA
jgi:predicted DNA-binding WGR domain protein